MTYIGPIPFSLRVVVGPSQISRLAEMGQSHSKGHQDVNAPKQSGEVDHVSDDPPTAAPPAGSQAKVGESILIKQEDQSNPIHDFIKNTLLRSYSDSSPGIEMGALKSIDLDDMITRLLDAGYSTKITKTVCLKNTEIVAVCTAARELFLSQPALLELSAPVKVVGDIHSQYTDLIRLFKMCGFPPVSNYLFLGDYVDRGKQGLETILLLLCYKLKFPEKFFLLRGNHECANLTRVYGFYDECKRRCNIKIWKTFIDTFNCLPIAATIADKVFCVHGGLSPSLSHMDDIRNIARPTDIPDYGLLSDLLWSDPADMEDDWEPNERGVSYCFNKNVIMRFLQRHDFDLICRAHMVVEDGYEFYQDRVLVTVFSAPNYCGEFDNWGAIMSVSSELLCSFELLKPVDSTQLKGHTKRDRKALNSFSPGLFDPPTSIPDAIQFGGIESLKKLLDKQFDRVAVGKYAWIKDLSEAGYSYYEIADLLSQDETDTPWIYFEPNNPDTPDTPEVYPKNGTHVQGCVHRYSGELTTPDEPQTRSFCHENTTGAEKLQELCGLAGVIPSSRNPNEWNGSVTFKEQNSVAIVSYAKFRENGELDSRTVLDRITTALNRSCVAAGHMQASGLCCDSFTVIVRQSREPILDEATPPVSLCRINFLSALCILAELKNLTSCSNITESSVANTLRLLPRLLDPIFRQCADIIHPKDLDGSLHSLSYNQGHVGPMQPFFLDTPQRKIVLAGSRTGQSHSKGIIAELTKLTCIGDMVGGPVLTIKINQLSLDAPGPQDERRFDLLATAEDLLDTWGPGCFIAHRYSRALPCAIKICGGIIYAPRENACKFHWSRTPHPELLSPVNINPRSKIFIGSIVAVNPNCSINEQECWERSSCAFDYLGVYDDFWTHDESQVGFQAGSYVQLQAHITKHRLPGKTMKQIILEWETEMLIPALNCLWGLQVSFCTGVSKRVPLRELIADVFPIFAKTFLREQALWLELETQYHILAALRTDAYLDSLERLPPELYSYLMRVVRRIVLALQSTGIDPEGRYLSVAWPYGTPPFRCFRIPCHDRASSWTRILADSEDCATFAYISTYCLVADEIQCRGPSPLWRSTAPLLGTAIFRHNNNPSNSPEPLESKKTYFFKKSDSLLKVVVERKGNPDAITLFVSPSSVPARMRKRLYRMDMMKNRWTQVRERQRLSEYAEHVAVLTKYEAGT
ncbi:hypothetical protein BDV06DRAFT_182701 [Aspergillus oleicola]